MDSVYVYESPFVLEDFNADGYQDLTVRCDYADKGDTDEHYIFNPAKAEFVKLDKELEYAWSYYVDLETRKLYMSYLFNFFDQRKVTYQWSGEMDYEKVKEFVSTGIVVGDMTEMIQIDITRYENGEEEVISNFQYGEWEYLERDDILFAYYEDFIWEKEVTDKTTGKKYTLRYAEGFISEEAVRYANPDYGNCYDGRLYVYDEDTYLIRVIHSEIGVAAESIEWDDGDEDREQALVIHDPDGGRATYYLSVLLRPDYQQPE